MASPPPPPPFSENSYEPFSGNSSEPNSEPFPGNSSEPTAFTSSSSSSISIGAMIGIVVAAVIVVSALILLCCLCKRRHVDTDRGSNIIVDMPSPPPSSHPPAIRSSQGAYSLDLVAGPSFFTYEELERATDRFAECNFLGEGGFGRVYKGVLSGKAVAVKQWNVGGQQGDTEFRAEVDIISRIHHRNVVSLVGHCIADSQRLLVYDFVPNNTLEYHLHERKKSVVMDWPTREKIAIGAAWGIAYLHEDCRPPIIHRDIKSSNILLDDNFEARVSDFGLAKPTSDTTSLVRMSRLAGTFGYMAPEYALSGNVTRKSDTFSFGVVLLELVTGQEAVDRTHPHGPKSLVERARGILEQINSEGDLGLLADPSLNGAYDKKGMLRMIRVAAACISYSPTQRPKMGQVARALEGETVFNDFARSSDCDNSNYSTDTSRKFLQSEFAVLEYSSENNGATSDCGVNCSASSSEYQTCPTTGNLSSKPMKV